MIEVLSPGLQSSLQDAGRHGFRHSGVGRAGAADGSAHWLANRLLGNPETAATLEITLLGPRLRLRRSQWLALAGAAIDTDLDGQRLAGQRPFKVKAGAVLRLGRCRGGARSYLAGEGGWEVDVVLGSRSTDLRAGFGGLHGRALRRGDRLQAAVIGNCPLSATPRWWVAGLHDPERDGLPDEVLRFLPEIDFPLSSASLLEKLWRVDPRSNRQALRLAGPALPPPEGGLRVSAPVHAGAIQILPGGEPLLLGPEAQTVGGYPLLGWVIGADLDRLGQLRPADPVRLLAVDLAQAEAAARRLAAQRARLDLALTRHAGL